MRTHGGAWGLVRDLSGVPVAWRAHVTSVRVPSWPDAGTGPALERLDTGLGWPAVGVACAGVLAALLVVRRVRQRKRAQQLAAAALVERTAELETALSAFAELERALRRAGERNRKLVQHGVQSKENERKRIARELHDELGQSILAAKIDLSSLLTLPLEMSVRLRLLGVLSQLDSCMLAVRLVINDLRPQVLDLGLDAALEWEASSFTRRSGLPCRLHLGAVDSLLPEEITVALYRIVQESLTNIKRHANAREVEISLLVETDRVHLRVRDDGVGLPSGPMRKDAFGLIGMQERAQALGGCVRLDSQPGAGTMVVVELPLAVPAEPLLTGAA